MDRGQTPVSEAEVEAVGRELYRMCSEEGIPWEFCPAGRVQVYRDMARRVLLVGLAARPLAESASLARAEVLKVAARALLAKAKAYDAKWLQTPRPSGAPVADWDKGYVAGMERAAHDVANSIDRPVRDDTKVPA